MNYASAEQCRAALAGSPVSTAHDTQLEQIASAVSDAIDHYCQRSFRPTLVTQTRFNGCGYADLYLTDFVALTTVEYSTDRGATWTALLNTDYAQLRAVSDDVAMSYDTIMLLQTAPIQYFPQSFRAVRVSGLFGYTSDRATATAAYASGAGTLAEVEAVWFVPLAVQQACIIETVRLFKRGQQAFSDVSAISELGQLYYNDAIDKTALSLLAPYRRVI